MNYEIKKLSPFGIMITPKDKRIPIRDLDLNRNQFQKLFNEHQLIVLRNFKTFKNSEDFSQYCESWGEISLWPFGKVLELLEQDNPKDHIFDHSYVPLHWDGMYREQVPEYQIFHCAKAPLKGHGGRTTFSNTLISLERLSPDMKTFLDKIQVTYKRKMEFYHSQVKSKIITKHPLKDYFVIRYNEPYSTENGPFINPPEISFEGVNQNDIEILCKNLKELLYHPENFYAHEWQESDIVIADNFSLLHGREAFTSKSPRHIQRVQVLSNPPYNNEDLESYS